MVFQAFVQATTGGGGWPMSVFIAPDNLKPFFGGTYFPSKRQYGRPSFLELLNRIDTLWHSQKSDLIEQADKVITAIRENEEQESEANAGDNKMSMEELQDVLLVNAFRQISKGYDAKLGGFSRAPKFPRPVVITAALAYWWQYVFRLMICVPLVSDSCCLGPKTSQPWKWSCTLFMEWQRVECTTTLAEAFIATP
jgi:uncharacterized protein